KVNQAFHYLVIHKPAEAMIYLKTAEMINSKLNYDVWTSYIQSGYGFYFSETGDNVSARLHFQRALQLDHTFRVPWVRYIFKNTYINFLLQQKDYEEAKTQTNELLGIGKQSGNNYFRLVASGFLKEIYALENKMDSACYYAKQELALKDTV